MSAPMGGPWTRHGHDIPGVTVAGGMPPAIARCGGPALCRQCREDVALLRGDKPATPDRPTREQVDAAAARIRRFLDARPVLDDGTEHADIARTTGPGSPNTGWPLATSDVRDVLAERDGLAAEVRALRAELDEQGNELTVRRLQDLVAARTSQGAGEGWDDASDADRRQALRSALRHRDALADELGLEAGMRTAAVDELETLRRRLWELLDDDQLSDDATVDALRAALVARTPQPAERDIAADVAACDVYEGTGDWCPRCGWNERAHAAPSAPLPAVPDGEADDLRARWLAHVAEHGTGPGPVLPPSIPDGDDVPARLAAAAEALASLEWPGASEEFRHISFLLKHDDAAEVRAAVAAALGLA